MTTGRSHLRLVLVAALITMAPIPAIARGASKAGASLPLVVGCSFTFGPNSALGAAGTLQFAFELVPVNPVQDCTTSITFMASVEPRAGLIAATGPYTNVDNDPLIATETVSFIPGRLPPSIGVAWASGHCADPAVPGTMTLSANGQHTAVAVDPNSCGPVGAPHSALRAAHLPDVSQVGISRTADDHGYDTVNVGGSITSFGDATNNPVNAPSAAPVVAIQNSPLGNGAWVVASDGGVFAYNTPFYGSLGGVSLNAPVVGMASTPDGHGYWLVAADGGVFAFGDATYHGSMGATRLNGPIVGIGADPDGGGYWLVGIDGGVFAFGDAAYHGSLGNVLPNAPMVGMASGSTGYWLVAADGGVFAFNEPFKGSMVGLPLNAPIAGMAATSSDNGYWMLGADDGVYAFGDAGFYGSDPIWPIPQ